MAKKQRGETRAPGAMVAGVLLRGIADVQFDRLVGGEGEVPIEQKMYLNERGELYLPAPNLLAFFYSSQYQSCAKMFWTNTKTQGKVIQQARATIFADPLEIPFTRGGKPVTFGGFKKSKGGKLYDDKADIWVDESLPRVKGAVVPDMNKKRPTLRKPWELGFELTVCEVEGSDITMSLVENWLRRGGVMIGVGTHRPVYGRFVVERFEVE